MKPHILIIGAGISGLAAAYRAQQALPEAQITVLEQGDRPGGTIWTARRDGFQIEEGPNGFLDTKPTTLTLCQELGLGNALLRGSEAARKHRYLFLGQKLQALPGSFGSFLTSELLSWRGKVALLWERFRGKGPARPDESILAFARRRLGREAADLLGDAMVTGIYAGDPALLSLRACFPRIHALEQEYGSVLKGMAKTAQQRRAEAKARGQPYERPGTLWSLRGGLRQLVETLAGQLKQPPQLNVAVQRIERGEAGRWRIVADGGSWDADAVLLTCPAYRQAVMLHALDRELAEQLGAIPYNAVVVVGLAYEQRAVPGKLDGFGFIAPQKLRRDLLGVQWCSSIYAERAPADRVLLRAMCGGWHRPEMVNWDDAALLEALRVELRLAMGITAPPLLTHVVRWRRAIPQYLLGHTQRVASIAERQRQHRGLFLGGNAYHGVALNDCTEQAGILAAQLRDYLKK